MALQKTDTINGVTYTDAYHRICEVRGDPKGTRFLVKVATWDAKATRDAGHPALNMRVFKDLTPDVSAVDTNVLKDLYAKVKAATEDTFFSDATDLLA